MQTFAEVFGRERTLEETSRALHATVQRLDPRRVGALHVTCADEAEIECVHAFQEGFVKFTLPSLKTGLQAPFTLANLGARYEWGSVAVAENHFTDDLDDAERPLLVLKINAHCGCEPIEGGAWPYAFGRRERYGHDTTCCGMLDAVLSGIRTPAAQDIRDLFASEGRDRLAVVQNDIDPTLRPLVMAIVEARLQIRAALLDIQDHAASTHTAFVVLGCVTLNRPDVDHEIVVGAYLLDARHGAVAPTYRGLGDRPEDYAVSLEHGHLVVTDPEIARERTARDHRQVVRAALGGAPMRRLERALDASGFEPVRRAVQDGRHRDPDTARRLMGLVVPMLSEAAPVPAAALLFAEGAAGMHHVFAAHRLVDPRAAVLGDRSSARRILADVEGRIDRMPPDRAAALLETLGARVPAR